MLNNEQNRNYDRAQRLSIFFDKHASVYASFVPFTKEKQSFTANFNLFKSYVPQKDIKGTSITKIQQELKLSIATQVTTICAMASSYAQAYNDTKLVAAMKCSKTSILNYKDADLYGMVLNIVNTLQPYMSDAHFMEYDISADMLSDVLTDATTYSSNLGTASVIDTDSSIANKNINAVIKLIDKNIEQFNRLINRFNTSNPDFVAGYRINAALGEAPRRHAGVEGIITSAVTGKPVPDAVVNIVDEDKSAVSSVNGEYTILRMYGRTYELAVTAPGFAVQTLPVRVYRGKITKLNIAI